MECMLCEFCEVVVNVDRNDFSLNVLGLVENTRNLEPSKYWMV